MSAVSPVPGNKLGLPPGTLIHQGPIEPQPTRLKLTDFSSQHLEQVEPADLESIGSRKDNPSITWLEVEGLGDIQTIAALGELYGVHPLVLEDILSTRQRPKLEEHDNYLFIVLKAMRFDREASRIDYEQVSLLVFENNIITFRERPDTLFAPIHQRLERGRGRIRQLGSDYLAYTILDTLVDDYFNLSDTLGEQINDLEERLLGEPEESMQAEIQFLRREAITIRRNLLPLRELVSDLIRDESELISEETHIYYRDVLDHALRAAETIESHREILASLLEIYNSSLGNRMNEVMKVLTIFASIFIPLTFIAGIYGMNFEFMPELKWRWAYPTLWIAFIAIALGLLIYFRRKRWL